MKTRKVAIVLSLAVAAISFVSCNETINNVEETLEGLNIEKSSDEVSDPGDACTFSGTLTEAEIEGLLEMREEEKLAGDIYKKLYTVYEVPIFNNISKSENAHTSAVLYLLNGYGIEDPALAEDGEFTNEAFTNLYKTLVEKGSENLIEALKVGAFIEEFDIADLWRLLDETQNEDLKRVYSNLLRGSKIHLRAFTNMLELKGETYEPTIITTEEYLEIITIANTEQEEETTSIPTGTCDATGPNT